MTDTTARPRGLDALLSPRRIAVVGASPRPGHFANQPLVNLRRNGFTGEVYPVNPSHAEVEGLPCYPSIDVLPETPDLAVIVVRPDLAIEALAACGESGVGAAVVVAAGFAETGDETGVELQKELLRITSETGIRLCGPNTLGVANFNDHTVPFVSGNIPEEPIAGPIAIVSQSGGCGFTILNRAWGLGIGVGHLAIAGNEIDVTIPELVSYYLHREDVRTVLVYMEALRDVAGLREAGLLAARVGKPVFVMKTGATAAGQRAAAAHTGALATSDAVCDVALRQWGLLRAHTFDSLVAAGALAARFHPPPTGRLGVYGQGGGLAVVTADLFSAAGHQLPQLDSGTVSRIKELMPDTTPGNPFDSGGQFLSSGVEVLVEALSTFGDDPNLDALVYCLMPVAGHRIEVYAEGIARAAKASRKPGVVLQYRAGELTERATAIFSDADLLALDPPESGIEGLGLWLQSAHVRPQSPWTDKERQDSELAAMARELAREWSDRNGPSVGEHEVMPLLERYGLPVTKQAVVTDAGEAVEAARRLTAPFAVKIASSALAHRSDVGGILLDVPDAEAVGSAYERVVDNARAAKPDLPVDGVIVSEMAKPGSELIIGTTTDDTFGPVILLGLGGIWTEVLEDVALRLPPLTLASAEEMVLSLRGAPILLGGRGQPAIDLPALCDVLVHVSELALDLGTSIRSMDLNPVIVGEHWVTIADALIETND